MGKSGMVKYDPTVLGRIMRSTLSRLGVNDDSVAHAVTAMIQTSLRGVDSHGINLFPHYYRSYKSGRLNKEPEFMITNEGPSFAIMDADHAIGHHAGAFAMQYAIGKATGSGIGAVAVKDSSHFGAAAYFGLMAAKQGMLGLAFTNADALVKAHNGRNAFFGTNPICFTAPMEDEEPFCLDMATSQVSWNKIKNYRREDKPLEPGWANDAQGLPVIDPHSAASLNPIGLYKGFGLGMMIDILCSAITSSVSGKDMLPMFTSAPDAHRHVGHFFMAIDVGQMTDLVTFRRSLQSLCNRVRAEEPFGDFPVMVAGDPEKQSEKYRKVHGIPVLEEVHVEFCGIDKDFMHCTI